MKDLIESVRLQLYQRLSSPLFGSFVIAWLCWNHRYLFILFSNEPIAGRLKMAHELVYPDDWALWGRGLVWPLVSSLCFILVYPYPSKWLFGYWHKRQIELKKTRDELEGAMLLTRDESRKIIRDASKVSEQYESQIEKLTREIDALKAPRDALDRDQRAAEQLRERIAALEHELKRRDAAETQQRADMLGGLKDSTRESIVLMLKSLANGGLQTKAGIAQAFKIEPARAQYLLETAAGRGLIKPPVGGVPGGYVLSAKGRAYLVEHDLL